LAVFIFVSFSSVILFGFMWGRRKDANDERTRDRSRDRSERSSQSSIKPVHAASAPLDPHSGPGDASLSHPFVGAGSR